MEKKKKEIVKWYGYTAVYIIYILALITIFFPSELPSFRALMYYVFITISVSVILPVIVTAITKQVLYLSKKSKNTQGD